MKIYTGDRFGLIKCTVFPPKKTDKQKKRAKEDESALAPQTTVLGKKMSKEAAVDQMAWGSLEGQRQLVVARRNGSIHFMSPDSGDIVREYKEKHAGERAHDKLFVGLHATESHLLSCTSEGHVAYTPLSSTSPDANTVGAVENELRVMRAHPTQPHLFATGGKERELSLYDINTLSLEGNHKKLFEARNVRNDEVDIRQPVWVSDLQFMNEDATKVAIASHYGQIRLYDTKDSKAKRRPTMNIQVNKNPRIKTFLTSLSIGKDYNHVIYTDNRCNVGMVDLRTKQVVQGYPGFSGAATATLVTPHPTFTTSPEKACVASISLNGDLRVHAVQGGKEPRKAYLKHALSALLIDESYVHIETKSKEEQESEEEEEAIWSSMETVKRKRKLAKA